MPPLPPPASSLWGEKTLDYRDSIGPVRALADGMAAFDASLEALARRGALEPPAFAAFAAQRFFEDWLAPAAESACAAALLPADFVAGLALRRREAPARVARLVAFAAEVRDALAAAGIESLVLKGLAHAERWYPAPERRHQWDVDLLVREPALPEVFARLGAAGFTARKAPAHSDVVRDWIDRVQSGALHHGKHSLEARREGMRVDVHWRIGGRLADRIDHEALWKSRRSFEVGGQRFETLADEPALTLLLQGIAADLKRGACKGKQWLDLYLALRAQSARLDWPAFLAARSREALLRVSVNVLSLLTTCWSCEAEFPALAAALAPHRRRILLPEPADAVALLERERGAPENRAWYSRLYPRTRLQHAAWQLADSRA
jgi:hypothetical protein